MANRAHQPDFKGFSLKSIKSNKPTEQDSRSGRRTTGSTPAATSATPVEKGARSSKATPVPPASKPLTSTSSARRSTPTTQNPLSSLKSQSPSFKIAWGKTLIIAESKRQEAAESRASSPAHENNVPDDDNGGVDDFGADEVSPSPTRDAPVPARAPARTQEASNAKRKLTSTPVLDTTSTTATRKTNPVPIKRRRLIQEETDENEEPLPPLEDLAQETSKTPANSRTTKSTSNAKEGTREGSTKTPAPATKDSLAVKSGLTEAKKSKTTSASLAKPAKKTKETTRQGSTLPLRQMTLMQLNSKSGAKEAEGRSTSLAARSRVVTDDDSGGESDFARSNAKKPTSKARSQGSSSKKTVDTKKGKGPSEETVKNYKQLQIHCLKFWGPSSAAAKPATVRNKEIAQKLPVDGENTTSTATSKDDAAPVKKSVQGILQIESAPLSEMDVIADAVRDVVDNYIDTIEDQALAKELLTLRSELETRLIEQVDMLDDHSLLRASVKKAAAVKKELRVQLLETQRQRQRTRQELAKVRADFEREQRARQRLEETHKFLTDLESLRDEVVGSDEDEDDDDDREQTDSSQHDNIKARHIPLINTGLQSYIATVGARSGGAGQPDSTDTRPGMLGALVEFNRLLETMVKSTPSVALSGSDSDSSDYDL
ncbi:hypothetical protein BGX29_000826 [Mortierella sp. GBA35]|nr:hypothetical protein BGX29_000826 [Mortierella sp. GBA35]